MKEALAADEEVRATGRLHWILWARAIAALVLLGVFVVGVIIFVQQLIINLTTEIAVTDRRIIMKYGWLQRRVMQLNLTSIEAVDINQDLAGRIFGYGRVTVHGTGDDEWSTPLIADPTQLARALAPPKP